MSAPQKVLDLIATFSRNIDDYRSSHFNEAMLRQQFVNPLFESLGWDMDNKQGYAEAYKDVIHEDSIKIGGATKAPDYCFRIGGTRKFFLEAKKPAVNIKNDPEPAYQLRRYAWSAKLPLSILTNFAELAVYDCRVKPNQTDKASVARILYLSYADYAKEWEQIAGVFSRDAILKGSFDKYADSKKAKRGTATVDTAFLDEIERWRAQLAKNFTLRNPELAQRELNYAVQITIDRIIFLRMCEARGIEPYGQLRDLQNDTDIYDQLRGIFRKADQRYNSGLFYFEKEDNRSDSPDVLTPQLKIDDKVLKPIFKGLYYPDSPYEFSVLPAEILGQVYEQFLGKVIRLTAGRHVKVEDKPEVKKAGGIFYTPTYIVDYIVKYTVGKLLERKTPKQAVKLKILDPACGSGSFLIGAYQFLLDWHQKQYVTAGPENCKKELFQAGENDWRLTTAERKRILLANIFGVDIDPQAVEVTKLSLLLKVLEGESNENLNQQLVMFHERALPDLGGNIKCGNSIIGPDFYHRQQLAMFDEEESYRINVFDWNAAFPKIMQAGGFDAVIGNPPYLFTRGNGIDELQKQYFYANYRRQSAQLNTFGIFLERSHELLRKDGLLGFITPNNWLTINSFAPLRSFLLTSCGPIRIVNVLDRVFAAAHVDTAITIFDKAAPSTLTVCEMLAGSVTELQCVDVTAVSGPEFIIQISLLKDAESQHVLAKIDAGSVPLGNVCTVSTGLKAYQTGKGKPKQSDTQKRDRAFHAPKKIDDSYGRYLDGVDVARYNLNWSGEYLSYGDWLAEPRKSVPFQGDRLLVRQIPSKPPYLVNGAFADKPFYNDINSMVVFAPADHVSLKYLLGLINSRLLSFWFQKTYDKLQRKIFPQFKVNELARFPVRAVDFTNPADKSGHDRTVELVEHILVLHKQLAKSKAPHDKVVLQTRIDAIDRQIDQLVYELYGLTKEEIKIVEAGTAKTEAPKADEQ